MRIFITGLTGTLGTALTELHHSRGDQVWGCARSESKAVEWLAEHGRKATLFLSCAGRLAEYNTDIGRILSSMDRVYHCAAIKHVDICEQHPATAFTQNVSITEWVSMACLARDVPLVFISSDKACLPQGVYGATKLLGEKIALKYGAAVVRLGNLIGSSGSVFHKWKEAKALGEVIKITDPEMTRFFIRIEDAAAFLADECMPGKIVAPVMRSIRMGDVAKAMSPKGLAPFVTGMRPGETMHQWLIAPRTRGYKDGMKFILDDDRPENFYQGISSAISPTWNIGELLEVVQ